MKRRVMYGVIAAALGLNLLVGAWIFQSSAVAAEKESPYASLKLFSYALERVRKDYVDGQKLTYQDLVYAALKGMLNTLDPHSEFMDPEKYKELQNDTQGAFGGVGLIVQLKDNFITVVAPMTNTPGFKAGIRAGDRIVKIGGASTSKMSTDEAVKILRGEPGTTVKITVFRPASEETKEYELTRASINVEMVTDINGRKEFALADNKIGYVRLTQFGDKTSDDLELALKKLKKQGMQALILDLRWNPGGLLDQAVDVCAKFLPKGQLVVTTEGRNPSENKRRYAMGHDELSDMPMVVLVNLGQRQCLGNRGRLSPGPQAGHHPGRNDLRERLRAEHPPARGRFRSAPDNRQVFYAQPQGHPQSRHHAGCPSGVERRGRGGAADRAHSGWRGYPDRGRAPARREFRTIPSTTVPSTCSKASCFLRNARPRRRNRTPRVQKVAAVR